MPAQVLPDHPYSMDIELLFTLKNVSDKASQSSVHQLSKLDILANSILMSTVSSQPVFSSNTASEDFNMKEKAANPVFQTPIIPTLSSWYPQPLMHFPLSYPPQNLPVLLRKVTIHQPIPPCKFLFDQNSESTVDSDTVKKKDQQLPPLPLTIFLNMPTGRTACQEQMRIAACRFYFCNTSIESR